MAKSLFCLFNRVDRTPIYDGRADTRSAANIALAKRRAGKAPNERSW